MYSDFVFLDRFLFELSCKKKHTHTNTDTHTHRDSNEYPIVAFSKNATIIITVHWGDTQMCGHRVDIRNLTRGHYCNLTVQGSCDGSYPTSVPYLQLGVYFYGLI